MLTKKKNYGIEIKIQNSFYYCHC